MFEENTTPDDPDPWWDFVVIFGTLLFLIGVIFMVLTSEAQAEDFVRYCYVFVNDWWWPCSDVPYPEYPGLPI